jgi:transposase-like protein
MTENVSQKLDKVIKIDKEKIHQHLGKLVRGTVEEALNKLLDAEAEQLCNAARYERTEAMSLIGAIEPCDDRRKRATW